jgi:hypothetical protein
MRVAVAFLITVLVLILGCDYKRADPARPAGVPQEAFWVGGPDGGVFVEIRETPGNADSYKMTIFHDQTGKVLYRGPAHVQPAGRGIVRIDDPRAFSGWDGEKMILADGRTLEPAEAGRH